MASFRSAGMRFDVLLNEIYLNQKHMTRCDVCGGSNFHTESVSEIFEIDGRHILVEDIPAQVCSKCGEMTFDRTTTERVRRMVHGEAQPVGTIELEVFAYA
jgi:YgiT-type zinc finger domain-containing protein